MGIALDTTVRIYTWKVIGRTNYKPSGRATSALLAGQRVECVASYDTTDFVLGQYVSLTLRLHL